MRAAYLTSGSRSTLSCHASAAHPLPRLCTPLPLRAARNVPTQLRSTAVGIITAASYAGTALAFGIAPTIITHLGWPWVFYLFGGSALLWLPFWLPLPMRRDFPSSGGSEVQPLLPGAGTDSCGAARQDLSSEPLNGMDTTTAAAAPAAPAAARMSLEVETPPPGRIGALAPEASSSTAAAATDASTNATGSSGRTGFLALMRRREVWAICGCQYAQAYGMFGLLTWLPSFFSDYYGVSVGNLGGFTFAPYILQVCGCGKGSEWWW